MADKGVLYGVGVGPGDPGLMTLKAVETIKRCPVVAAPRTPNGGMVALDIARGAVDFADKLVLPLDFAMSRDAGVRAASHRAATALVREHLDQGTDVALLNLGDVSIYASFQYIATLLDGKGYRLEMIPGVPSFCAAAALLGTGLTEMGTTLRIIPEAETVKDEALRASGTSIWMKSGKNLPNLLARLAACGLSDKAILVQNCGMANQRVIRDVAATEVGSDYFSLVIVKNDGEEAAP